MDHDELTRDLADMSADAEDAALDAALEAKEAAAAKVAADNDRARKRQRLADLDGIAALRDEFGVTNIVVLDVPYTPGLPTCIAARTPDDPEIKRYRHRLAAGRKPGAEPDPLAGVRASEELADVCRVFPADVEVYARMKAARPGIHVQLGSAAVKLATASAENEGKA